MSQNLNELKEIDKHKNKVHMTKEYRSREEGQQQEDKKEEEEAPAGGIQRWYTHNLNQ